MKTKPVYENYFATQFDFFMKSLSFILLFLTYFSTSSFACFCWGPDSFCEFIEDTNTDGYDLIVKGTNIREVAHGMDFKITEIYKGEESKEVIRIWGDLGWLCRWYTSRFPVGGEYYFALYRMREEEDIGSQRDPASPFEKEGDYTITFCGKSYWQKGDEDIWGETEAEVLACLEYISGTSNTEEIDFCEIGKSEIYPNPASTEIHINLPEQANLTNGHARIFDDCGKLVYQTYDINEFYHSGNLTINTSTFASGLYFLDLRLPDLCIANLTRRFVVKN